MHQPEQLDSMLGFNAPGWPAFGQVSQGGISTVTLPANAGSYSIVGSAGKFADSLVASGAAHTITGRAVSVVDKLASSAGCQLSRLDTRYGVFGNMTRFIIEGQGGVVLFRAAGAL